MVALALRLAEAPSTWVSVEEPSASLLAEALLTWVSGEEPSALLLAEALSTWVLALVVREYP